MIRPLAKALEFFEEVKTDVTQMTSDNKGRQQQAGGKREWRRKMKGNSKKHYWTKPHKIKDLVGSNKQWKAIWNMYYSKAPPPALDVAEPPGFFHSLHHVAILT